MTYYLTDIGEDNLINRVEILDNDDFMWYFGISEEQARETGVVLTTMPENPYNAVNLYANIENQTAWYDISVEDFKQKHISMLSGVCTNTIYNGMDIQLSTGIEHFTLDAQDQANLTNLMFKVIQGATEIKWHSSDKNEPCKAYNTNDFLTIISNLEILKQYHITYYRDLRIYVNGLETIEEINAIEYGFELPESAKSDTLKEYEVALNAE